MVGKKWNYLVRLILHDLCDLIVCLIILLTEEVYGSCIGNLKYNQVECYVCVLVILSILYCLKTCNISLRGL
jgi:hypothetical protein